MYGCELDCEKSWAPKNWCFCTVVLEKTLESPLDCKEIQPVHPKGDQSWVFIGRTDAEAETPILWPLHAKSWLIGKDPDAGEGLGAEGQGDNRGWDGCMASPTQWTWVWVNFRSWWWTGRPGMLRFMELQSRTRLSNWTEVIAIKPSFLQGWHINGQVALEFSTRCISTLCLHEATPGCFNQTKPPGQPTWWRHLEEPCFLSRLISFLNLTVVLPYPDWCEEGTASRCPERPEKC